MWRFQIFIVVAFHKKYFWMILLSAPNAPLPLSKTQICIYCSHAPLKEHLNHLGHQKSEFFERAWPPTFFLILPPLAPSGQSPFLTPENSDLGTHRDRKKNMTARDVTGFYTIFSARQIGQLSPHFGAISLLITK